MNNKYDVIVIGGGHNGLVNAAYLARAGQESCLCSSADTCSAARRLLKKFFPVSSFPSALTWSLCLRPEIIRELDLPRHGLEIFRSTARSRRCQTAIISGA
jgi:phytoene dehydrogenase-like protein